LNGPHDEIRPVYSVKAMCILYRDPHVFFPMVKQIRLETTFDVDARVPNGPRQCSLYQGCLSARTAALGIVYLSMIGVFECVFETEGNVKRHRISLTVPSKALVGDITVMFGLLLYTCTSSQDNMTSKYCKNT
jgi:hypothetical protein